jgi:uncharacterized repeat protein (TIGR01451 family)
MVLIRRILSLGLAGLLVAAIVPALASAATPATARLLGTDPVHAGVTITHPDGTTVHGGPGLFRLRVTASGSAPAEYRGFCADLKHPIASGTDYTMSLRTASDEAFLATPRRAEAAWLVQQAERLIAAQPAAKRPLEAGALQVAVWQLMDEARETDPTSDAALNARAAAVRQLAAGRAVGGPVTITPAMPRGCAGGSGVALRLTGTPGSSAALSVTAGTGTLSATEVRFAADGTATVSVSSGSAGAVTVTARTEGGTLTRIARTRSTQSTPQETIVLGSPKSHTATATVTFENCPLIPSGGGVDPNPGTPTNTPSDTPTGSGPETPLGPFGGPAIPATPATPVAPRTPTQVTRPRLRLSKTGPKRVRAGAVAAYVITVRNAGGETLTDVTVADALPAGMSLTGMPAGARLRSGRVTWTIRSLKPGATRVLRVPVRLDADAAGRRCNRASAVAGTVRVLASSCTMVTAVRRPVAPAVTA